MNWSGNLESLWTGLEAVYGQGKVGRTIDGRTKDVVLTLTHLMISQFLAFQILPAVVA